MKPIFFVLFCVLTISACAQNNCEVDEGTFKVDIQSDSLKQTLSKEQRAVLCGGATEKPFSGKYYNHNEEGIYLCAACKNPLFISETKYESGSGWPSFYDAISDSSIIEKPDYSHGMVRTEIVCGTCGGHLGHLFNDGPSNKTGLRYCVNSLSLGFEKADSIKP